MTIFEGNKIHTFIVGNDSDLLPDGARKDKPRVFEDYAVFCGELEKMFMDEPGKFSLELG